MLFQGAMWRIMALLLLSAALIGCGGRNVGRKGARNLLVDLAPNGLQPDDIEVEKISQTGSRDAVIQAKIRAAFRVENDNGRWLIREVRLGDHQWERLDLILQALEKTKIEETRRILDEVAAGLDAYVIKNAQLPGFKDFVTLSDALYPGFLRRVIRLDAWERPLAAIPVGAKSVRLSSAGQDGKLGTGDDIQITRTYQ